MKWPVDLWGIKQTEKRIFSVKKEIADLPKKLQQPIPIGILEKQIEKAKEPLLIELDELRTKRDFAHDRKTVTVNLIGNILVVIAAITVAYGVPIWQENRTERASIQSLYQTIIANEDIFIANYNDLKISLNKHEQTKLPEPFIEYSLDDSTSNDLQNELGIIQYRFLLYYLNQTHFLNEQINQVRNYLTTADSSDFSKNQIQAYWSTLQSLDDGGWQETKFNYIHDTECILVMMQKSYPFIQVAKRDELIECSSESLNRLFNQFGYIPVETPYWLIPDLRKALNEREPGLGDRLIIDK